jgi:phage terminase small subunit
MAAKSKVKPKAGTSKEAAAVRKGVFVEAYIANGGNATEAAKTAGYSAKTARSQGQRLLTDVDIKSRVSKRAEETAKKYELTTELVVKTIVQELTFDPARLYQAGGQLKDITELDEDTRMALASVEFEQLGSPDAPVFVRKYKWAQRNAAREQAMKHLGMFKKDNEQLPSPTIILMDQITASPNSRIKVK